MVFLLSLSFILDYYFINCFKIVSKIQLPLAFNRRGAQVLSKPHEVNFVGCINKYCFLWKEKNETDSLNLDTVEKFSKNLYSSKWF